MHHPPCKDDWNEGLGRSNNVKSIIGISKELFATY